MRIILLIMTVWFKYRSTLNNSILDYFYMTKLFLSLLGLLFFISCEKETIIVQNNISGGAFGTSYNIIYLTKEKIDYQKEIDSVFAAVNKSMSTYIPTSDISKINRGDSTIVVDLMFKDVFNLSKEVFKATNGYFDPTVGTLVNAWGFGPKTEVRADSINVDSLMHYVGFNKISITYEGIIKKNNPNIYLDFNAVAKGYGIDRLGVLLDAKGVSDYLIEIGGEVLAKGQNTVKNKKWTIAIDDPQAIFERKQVRVLNLKNKALASSGNYRKFRIDAVTGDKYVHSIDPKTGFTKNTNVLGVTILADNCAEADAYATAFMVMDLYESINMLSNQEALDAYIIYLDMEGNTKEFFTNGFKALVLED